LANWPIPWSMLLLKEQPMSMADEKTILVEVAYAKPEQQVIIPMRVRPGTTLIEAIKESGILAQFPEINIESGKFGIFSKISKPDTVLREKDRVEIYRPLIADPKESRRKRAEKKKSRAEAEKQAE
jgi:putative ubiquitin-RnfH superfamily antitoxin RatB of RatAB toxin-antitoxin module